MSGCLWCACVRVALLGLARWRPPLTSEGEEEGVQPSLTNMPHGRQPTHTHTRIFQSSLAMPMLSAQVSTEMFFFFSGLTYSSFLTLWSHYVPSCKPTHAELIFATREREREKEGSI